MNKNVVKNEYFAYISLLAITIILCSDWTGYSLCQGILSYTQ